MSDRYSSERLDFLLVVVVAAVVLSIRSTGLFSNSGRILSCVHWLGTNAVCASELYFRQAGRAGVLIQLVCWTSVNKEQ
jgi:hypothetical protein